MDNKENQKSRFKVPSDIWGFVPIFLFVSIIVLSCLKVRQNIAEIDKRDAETVMVENEQSESSENSETVETESVVNDVVLTNGDIWTVDGQWKLTIDSIKENDYRNEYTPKNPKHVYMIDYTYENIGNKEESDNDVFIDLSLNKIVDEQGYMGYSYPGEIANYPQEVPVGAKCKAQACIGVDNDSSMITLIVEQHDSNFKTEKATFKLNID